MKAVVFRNYWIGVVLLAALISAAILNTAAAESLPDQVVIRRDSYGVPHILAQTEEAAALGLGYAQAEDHCMEIVRRYIAARGESAKYLGVGAENDFLIKLYDNLEVSRQDLDHVSPLYRKMVNAFAAGINRYVDQHRQELPDWIPVFTGVDVMAHRRAGAMSEAFSQSTVRELQKKYPAGAAAPQGVAQLSLMMRATPDTSDWEAQELPSGRMRFAKRRRKNGRA